MKLKLQTVVAAPILGGVAPPVMAQGLGGPSSVQAELEPGDRPLVEAVIRGIVFE